MRIVSLLPSATEIVCALDLADQLVAISHDCDWPPEIADRPVLSDSVIDTAADSASIDAQVRERVHTGRSIYHVDEERLRSLAPDLILTQELCKVCAPAFDEVQAAARIVDDRPRVVSLEPSSLDGILDNIHRVGEETGCPVRAELLIEGLRGRIDEVKERVSDADTRPRVLCLEWLDPLFLGGHWVPEMVQLAGGEPLGSPGEHSRESDWDEIRAFDPDRIVLMPCGFDLERTRSEACTVTNREEWQELRAVREGNVYITNGSAYFNRPGPRAVIGLEILAWCIHPEWCLDLPVPDDGVERLS